MQTYILWRNLVGNEVCRYIDANKLRITGRLTEISQTRTQISHGRQNVNSNNADEINNMYTSSTSQ